MQKIITIILLLITIISNAENNQYYKNVDDKKDEFIDLSHNYLEWYENNKSVVDYNFSKIDNHVLTLIKTNPNIKNIDILEKELSKICLNDLEKVRSYYIWLVYSMKYDISIRNEYTSDIIVSDTEEDDALYAFKNRRGACSEISVIFYILCKKGGVRAFALSGFVKDDIKSDGTYSTWGHSWNVFKYNNKYYYLDATFGLQTKNKIEITKKDNFIINPFLYKTKYNPYEVYSELRYAYGKYTYDQEKRWSIDNKTYLSNSGRVLDSNWIELNKVVEFVIDNHYIRVESKNDFKTWLNKSVFWYTDFEINNIKKYASLYKNIEIKNNISTPLQLNILKEKEYKKLNKSSQIEYNQLAEVYFNYWIQIYKNEIKNSSSADIVNNTKILKKYEWEYTYFKIFKK